MLNLQKKNTIIKNMKKKLAIIGAVEGTENRILENINSSNTMGTFKYNVRRY